MNALVGYRANSVGQLTPSPAQRNEAALEISSNLRAKFQGMLRKAAASKGVSDASSTKAMPEQQMDRDMFLQMLVMEMQHQDPLEPFNNREMIAQLAQFSSLEQATQLNTNFEALSERFDYFSGNMDQLNFISAQGLLGKYVEGVDAEGEEVTGQVESVQLNGSIVVLTVDGRELPMTGVTQVSTERPEADEDAPAEKGGK